MNSIPSTQTDAPVEATGTRSIHILTRLVIYSPWLWLVLFAVYVGSIALQNGQLPSYGQPDPKFAGVISILYEPTILLMLWVITSVPVSIVLYFVSKLLKFPQPFSRRDLVVYGVGLVLFGLIVFTDVGGLMTWLGD